MSVNCNITLPNDARLRDVADVMALLAGLKLDLESSYTNVLGVRTQTTGVPEMAMIVMEGHLADGEKSHFAYYHFEGERRIDEEHNALCRMVSVRSTPFWLAVGKGLVDFFGGWIDYSDCDDKDVDYKRPTQWHINASDGKAWTKLQERVRAVQPVTKAQMDEMREHAAYE